MDKQSINKDVTVDDLNRVNKAIEELNVKLSEVGENIFKNETNKKVLSKPSHYVFSIIHRAIELNRGFITLTNANNWITAVNLIRLQADNCMRLTALNLVKDKLDFYNKVISGEHIRNIKDADGKKMTDSYLSEKLEVIYPGFRLLYENISGYVHFSNQHIKMNTDLLQDNESFIMYIRLAETTELSIDVKVDFSYNMFYVGKDLFGILMAYMLHMKELMQKFD